MSAHQATHQPTVAHHATPGGLSASHVALLLLYGVFLWFLAALAIRYGTPAGVFGKTANFVVYALSIPVGFLLVKAAAGTGRLPPGTLLSGIVIANVGGLLGDAVALPWFPSIYGPEPAAFLPGVAWLFFGVACCLVSAVWLEKR